MLFVRFMTIYKTWKHLNRTCRFGRKPPGKPFCIATFMGAMAVCLILMPKVYGQDVDRGLISCGGGFFPSSDISLAYSMGEPVNASYASADVQLFAGFLPGDGRRKLIFVVLPEGLWNGTSLNKAQDGNGPAFGGNIADKVILSVAGGFQPHPIVFTSELVDLLITGISEVSLPAHLSGTNFLVVNHRNHIETWSAEPVSMANLVLTYSFAQSAGQAYGSNQKEIAPGIFALFAGDANKDGIIDGSDIDLIALHAIQFFKGYNSADINGDGRADARDLIITDNNAAAFIQTEKP